MDVLYALLFLLANVKGDGDPKSEVNFEDLPRQVSARKDFQNLSRRELQALCKSKKIPANRKTEELIEALQSLEAAEDPERVLSGEGLSARKDFENLSRRELQTLCKTRNIPANKKTNELIHALQRLQRADDPERVNPSMSNEITEVSEEPSQHLVKNKLVLRFRISDGSSICRGTYDSMDTISTLKQILVANWPRGKNIAAPESIDDLNLSFGKKYLEDGETLESSGIHQNHHGGAVTIIVGVQQTGNASSRGSSLWARVRKFFCSVV